MLEAPHALYWNNYARSKPVNKFLVGAPVSFMLSVLYIVGGAAIEEVFNSHPITAFFGFVMGVISCLCLDVIKGYYKKEQAND